MHVSRVVAVIGYSPDLEVILILAIHGARRGAG